MLQLRGNLLLDQLDRPSERIGRQCLEMRLPHPLIRQRKTHRRRRTRRIGETSHLSATTEALFRRHGDIDHPLEVEVIEATEVTEVTEATEATEAIEVIEEEDLLEDTQDPVGRVHLLNVDGATPGHLGDMADILCREAEAVLGTIVTDLLAEGPHLLCQDAGRPILVEDHVRQGDSVGDLGRVLP